MHTYVCIFVFVCLYVPPMSLEQVDRFNETSYDIVPLVAVPSSEEGMTLASCKVEL